MRYSNIEHTQILKVHLEWKFDELLSPEGHQAYIKPKPLGKAYAQNWTYYWEDLRTKLATFGGGLCTKLNTFGERQCIKLETFVEGLCTKLNTFVECLNYVQNWTDL